jgi:ComEC/Rec2-related protein
MVKRGPVAFYSLFTVLGILTGKLINFSHLTTLILLNIVLATSIIIYFFHFRKWGYTLILLFSLFFYLYGVFALILHNSFTCSSAAGGGLYNIIKIPLRELPRKKNDRLYFSCKLVKTDVTIIINLPVESVISGIMIGDTIVCKIRSLQISGKNKSFIYPESASIRIRKYNGCNFYINLLRWREKLISGLGKYFSSPENESVFRALIFGDRRLLSGKTLQFFAAAGIIHMLAISGLHTSLMYLMISAFFSFSGGSTVPGYVKSLFITCLIWMYAIITGFSDSVIRASFMITINEIATFSQRGKMSINNAGISALLMLSAEPVSVFNTGFQLSFLATISIILMTPAFKNVNISGGLFGRYIIRNSIVTLSGTAGTLLLTSLSFGRISIYFLLGNILVSPIITILMFLSIIVVSTIGFEPFNSFLFSIIEVLISIIRDIAQGIYYMPMSQIKII